MNNIRRMVQITGLVALTVLFQYLLRKLDSTFSSAVIDAALVLCLYTLGLRCALAAAVLIPWMTAAFQIIQGVLTYPMIFANLTFLLLFDSMMKKPSKSFFTALPMAALTKALVLFFMAFFVIGTWLEPHLQTLGSVNHKNITMLFHYLAIWRQITAALLGGGAGLAAAHIVRQFQSLHTEELP